MTADVLSAGERQTWSAVRAVMNARRSDECLVPLQPHGDKPPFFCVHGRAGTVQGFGSYIPHLGAEQPFYGLQAKGLNGTQPPDTSVPAMATRYLAEIRRVQPHGPYYLGGYCAGGAVAFDIAQQLLADGETIGALVMLDGPAPPKASFRMALRRLPGGWRRIRRGPKSLASYLAGAARRVLRRFAMRMARKPFRSAGAEPSGLLRYRSVAAAMHEARDYVPQSYPGRIVLFRSTEQTTESSAGPDLGWSEFATGGIEIHEINGAHRDFIEGKLVPEIARKLRGVLEEAQERG